MHMFHFLNSSVDAIVIYDLTEKAQFVSPSFIQIFGWTLEEVKNGDIPFLPDSERESNIKLFDSILEKGISISGFETKRNAKDGSILDVSISASRYHDHRGDPAGISVIFRDITSFKSIERARRRAVHHLSHELVTPLSVIETSLRKLGKNNLSDSLEGKSIQRIKRNLDRLKDIQAIVQEMVSPPLNIYLRICRWS